MKSPNSASFRFYEKWLIPILKIPVLLMEKCLLAGLPKPDLFNTDEYAWIKKVESAYPAILDEYLKYQALNIRLPAFSDLSPEQHKITDKKWRSLILLAFGRKIKGYESYFPQTLQAIQQIEGLQGAMFSVFEPGSSLKPHRGPYAGILRYHLALIVPEDNENCALELNGKTIHWAPGKSLLFDDTYIHSAWNQCKTPRVVLFVDLERPLPPIRKAINRFWIFMIAWSPFIGKVVINAEKSAHQIQIQEP